MSHFTYQTKCFNLLLLQGTLFFSFSGMMDKSQDKTIMLLTSGVSWQCLAAPITAFYYQVSGRKWNFHEGKISVLTFGLFYLVGPSACSEIAY